MPRAPPQNIIRAFKTRYNGIFKKASDLHEIDDSVRITVIVEKPGSVPIVFTTEEDGVNWPPLMHDYVNGRHPIIKRPSHYQSLSEGISTGRVAIVRTASDSPPPQYSPPTRGVFTPRPSEENRFADQLPSDGGSPSNRPWDPYMPTTPSRPLSTRTSSPLPIPFVLPSKMSTEESETR